MIDVKNVGILDSSICSLKETSKDNHDGTDCYMTNSMLPVVNFDMVKEKYVQGLKISEFPASNDALYVSNDGELYFIEFKAGAMAKKIYEVRRKIFDSLLILTDIINVGASYTRQHLNYILVYNEVKNQITETEKEELQVSPSRVKIGEILGDKGQEGFVRFNLKRFKGLAG